MIGQTNNVLLGNRKNYLILKDDVGKSKPTTRHLPANDFAFGKTEKAEEGASIICTSWKEYPTTDFDKVRKSAPRDFKSLNKKAVIQGAANAIMNTQFRKVNDARVT